jgi:hypothetical protein
MTIELSNHEANRFCKEQDPEGPGCCAIHSEARNIFYCFKQLVALLQAEAFLSMTRKDCKNGYKMMQVVNDAENYINLIDGEGVKH